MRRGEGARALIGGRFAVDREVGSGGMGTVFRCVDRLGGATVAVKILRGREELDIQRFEREAAILAELCDPGVVRYVAHGVAATGEHYLAMEWLDGEDLAARLARGGLSFAESVAVLRRAGEALAGVHARGMVHRDLKPQNLFLAGGDVERLKVLDFGIARVAGGSARLTRTGVLLGTPAYLAPEQIHDPGIHDPRTDVFSLGCVFYECLAGRPAFEGAHAMAVLAKILFQETPRLRDARPDAPEAFDRLVARMLAKDPGDRPRDAGELAAEVAGLGDGPAATASIAAIAARTERSLLAPPGSTPLPDEAPASLGHREHRLVSVVLAGDPDATSADLDWPEEDLEAAVLRLGGHLSLLAGGSLVVTIWGAGSATDRAERAAQCALDLRARFRDLPICVVTGRGLVSAKLVEGAVIERGVRDLRAARPGEIALDDVTAGMVAGRFQVDREGSAAVLRGEGARREITPLLLGKATPCLGRGRELAILDAMLSGCVEEQIASAVLVVGPAGSGKSRLRREFLEQIRRRGDRITVLSGRGDVLGEGSPFGLITDAIRRTAEIADEPVEARRRKLVDRLGRHLAGAELTRVAAFLGELSGTPFSHGDDPALRAARGSALLMSDATRVAWEDWLAAECAAGPVLLVLEDLHWGDAATVSLVDSTLRNLRELPLMALVLARPEVYARFPALWAEREVQSIKLGPLGRKASEALAREALSATIDADRVARIVERACGNPFYLEELIRAVVAGREDALPDSVLGTVEARLDAEGDEAKRVLRAAAVFGDRFTSGGVASLLGGDTSATRAWLDALTERELIGPASGAAPSIDAQYAFQHALVRDAAYATLTDGDRVLGHRLAGDWLERTSHPSAVAVAEHFHRGGERGRSAQWCRRAAEQALDANDLPAALESAGRGVERGAAGLDLGMLRLIEAEATLWRGELALAERRGLEAIDLLAPGSAAWFKAVTRVVSAAGKLGRYDHVEVWLGPARSTPPEPGARSLQIVCLSECAAQLVFGARFAAADELLEALDRNAPDPGALEAGVAGWLYQARSFRASAAGDPAACVEGFTAALAAFEQAADRRNASSVRGNLGYVLAELGDFEGAEAAMRAALEAAHRMGLNDVATTIEHNLGHALVYCGRLDEARILEQRAVEAFRTQGDPRLEGAARTYLAKAALLSGDVETAEREARAAAAMLEIAPQLRAPAVGVLARALLGLGRVGEALAAAREAASAIDALGAIDEGESLVRLAFVEALAAAGETDELAVAIAVARDRLLARADRIKDPAWRERFLTCVPDNARTIALGR